MGVQRAIPDEAPEPLVVEGGSYALGPWLSPSGALPCVCFLLKPEVHLAPYHFDTSSLAVRGWTSDLGEVAV